MVTNNPIKSVTPIDIDGNVTGSAITNLPNLTSFEWKLADISGEKGGRSGSFRMNKMRKGQTTAYAVSLKMGTFAEGATLLSAFNPEYVRCLILDALSGGWITRDFFVQDRTAVLMNAEIGRWDEISFDIVQLDMTSV